MELKSFECKGCGTIIWVPEEQGEPLYCPLCRSSLTEVNVKLDKEAKEYTCPECENKFSIVKPPYKCAYCNYTFPSTPYLKQDEKL